MTQTTQEEYVKIEEIFDTPKYQELPEPSVVGEFSPVDPKVAFDAIDSNKQPWEYTENDELTLKGLREALTTNITGRRSDGFFTGEPTLAGQPIAASKALRIANNQFRSREKPVSRQNPTETTTNSTTPPENSAWQSPRANQLNEIPRPNVPRHRGKHRSSNNSIVARYIPKTLQPGRHQERKHRASGQNMFMELAPSFAEPGVHRAGRGAHHTHEKSAPSRFLERAKIIAGKLTPAMFGPKLRELSASIDTTILNAEQDRASAKVAVLSLAAATTGALIVGFIVGRENPDLFSEIFTSSRGNGEVDAAKLSADLGFHDATPDINAGADESVIHDEVSDKLQANLDRVTDVLERGGLLGVDTRVTSGVDVREAITDLPESKEVNAEAPGITYHMLADAQALGLDVNGWDVYDKVYTIMEAEGYMTKEHISGVGIYDMANGDVGFQHDGMTTYSEEFMQRQTELLNELAEKTVNK